MHQDHAIQEAMVRYPYKWQDAIPAGVIEAARGKATVNISAYYNVEYLQHQLFPQWITLAELRVLDIACGTGESRILSAIRYPQLRYVATDPSGEALAIARKHAEELQLQNIEFVDWNDIEKLSSSTFDIIACTRPLQQIKHFQKLLPKLSPLLQEQGVLALIADAGWTRLGMEAFQEQIEALRKQELNIEETHGLLTSLTELLRNEVLRNDGLSQEQSADGDSPVNIVCLNNIIEQAGLSVQAYIHPRNYDPAEYIDRSLAEAISQQETSIVKAGLAEILNGNMQQHYLLCRPQGRCLTMPALKDQDSKALIPWQSPYLIARVEADLGFLDLDRIHLLLSPQLAYEELNIPVSLLEIVRAINGNSSLEVIYRKFLPMSWDVFWYFIEALRECELIYLHHK